MLKFALVAVTAIICTFAHINNVRAYTDHGSAPAPYPDAIHTAINVANRLGNVMSVDDGVTFPATLPGNYTINYTITAMFGPAQGYIDAWVDWNQDKDWDDSGEHVFNTGLNVVSGSGSFNGIIPMGVTAGTTWMRVRLFVSPYDSPTMTATNGGEVEDYQVSHEASPIPEPATIALLGIGLAGVIGYSKEFRKKNAIKNKRI
jgi:hypothetical protein